MAKLPYTARTLPSTTTYEAAEALLGGRSRRELCFKTCVVRTGQYAVSVYHHRTPILTIDGGQITIRDGGYRSYTTRARLNRLLYPKYRIVQRDFKWSVLSKVGLGAPWTNETAFMDGMRIDQIGQPRPLYRYYGLV